MRVKFHGWVDVCHDVEVEAQAIAMVVDGVDIVTASTNDDWICLYADVSGG